MSDAEYTVEFIRRLAEVIVTDEAVAWMAQANPAFEFRRPCDLITAGEWARLEEVLYRLAAGEAS